MDVVRCFEHAMSYILFLGMGKDYRDQETPSSCHLNLGNGKVQEDVANHGTSHIPLGPWDGKVPYPPGTMGWEGPRECG